MNPVQHYLFIDIETVSCEPDFTVLSPALQKLWIQKCNSMRTTTDPDYSALYQQKAGIYSEFARVICISLGCIVKKEDGWKIFLRSFSGDDEKDILSRFSEAAELFLQREKDLIFCGHNIKEFDIPFLCRRMVINDLPLPAILDISGKKPWEVKHEDTMDLWRFGDKKNFTSLSLLAEILGIPGSKDDIDGSMVGRVYWEEKDAGRICNYCMKDVVTVARVFLRLKNISGIIPEPVYLP